MLYMLCPVQAVNVKYIPPPPRSLVTQEQTLPPARDMEGEVSAPHLCSGTDILALTADLV